MDEEDASIFKVGSEGVFSPFKILILNYYCQEEQLSIRSVTRGSATLYCKFIQAAVQVTTWDWFSGSCVKTYAIQVIYLGKTGGGINAIDFGIGSMDLFSAVVREAEGSFMPSQPPPSRTADQGFERTLKD